MSLKSSIILPVLNQEDHISRIIREYHKALAKIEHEFILVVNPSSDNSLLVSHALVKELGKETVRVVPSKHKGWGRSVLIGLDKATGDILCYTNSSRTTPEDLGLAIRLAQFSPEQDYVIKAMRRFRKSRVRRIGSLIYNIEARTIFDLASWDVNGTPKVFSRNIYQKVHLKERGDLIDLEFLVESKRNGFLVTNPPPPVIRLVIGRHVPSHFSPITY